jgi:hypothetical protein
MTTEPATPTLGDLIYELYRSEMERHGDTDRAALRTALTVNRLLARAHPDREPVFTDPDEEAA